MSHDRKATFAEGTTERELQHVTEKKDHNIDVRRGISLLITLVGSNVKFSQVHK